MERLAGSKALAAEVRILLQEVGKLRDEKRALQFEVSELLAMKVSIDATIDRATMKFNVTGQQARHSADGEYHPEWRPPHEPPAALAPPPPEPEAPSQELVLHQEAKSGWRALPKKHERKPREPRVPKAKMPEPPPPPAPAP
ncbi:hypothetical protein FRC17_006458, partial [Serendipita sp. 399]